MKKTTVELDERELQIVLAALDCHHDQIHDYGFDCDPVHGDIDADEDSEEKLDEILSCSLALQERLRDSTGWR